MDIDRLLPPVVTSAAAPPPKPSSKSSKSRRPAEPTLARKSFLASWLTQIAADVKEEALKPISYVYLALLAGLGAAVCMGVVSVRTPDRIGPATRPPAISRSHSPVAPQIRPVVPLDQPETVQTPTVSPSATQRASKAPEASSGPSQAPVTNVPPMVDPTPTPDPTPTVTPPVTPPADPSGPPAEEEKTIT